MHQSRFSASILSARAHHGGQLGYSCRLTRPSKNLRQRTAAAAALRAPVTIQRKHALSAPSIDRDADPLGRQRGFDEARLSVGGGPRQRREEWVQPPGVASEHVEQKKVPFEFDEQDLVRRIAHW